MPLSLDHFALIAPLYDRVFARPGPGRLGEVLAPYADGLLLDVGGGTGRVVQALGCEPARAVVADVSSAMVQRARERGFGAVVGAAESLPFAAGRFGRVVMVDAFHHLADQQQAAGEVWRVLASGGRAVIEEPDASFWTVRLIAWAEKALLMRSHFRSSGWIAELLGRLGAAVDVVAEGVNYWVVCTKAAAEDESGAVMGD